MRLLQPVSILWSLVAVDGVVATRCPVADTSIVKHEGDSKGKTVNYEGVDLYVTKPNSQHCRPKHDTAVLYLTDVFGVQLAQNRLLADSFARAGYVTVAPDLFEGDPAPEDLNTPGFNITEFLSKHGPQAADPIIEKAIDYMRSTLGVNKIATTGYCYGGKYAIRFIGKKVGADLAFAAHPSLLEDEEISAILGPASVAAAETDSMMPPERRHAIEGLLKDTGMAYQVSLYSGTQHGFGVRANVSDPMQKFAKETAFLQAVRWFEGWSS